MQPQSCSSFYLRMRQAYAPAGAIQHHQQQEQQQSYAPIHTLPRPNSRGKSVDVFRSAQEMVTRSPPVRAPWSDGQQGIDAISEVQQRLDAMQGRNSRSQQQQQMPFNPVVKLSSMMTRAASPSSPVISSSSSCSSNQNGPHDSSNHTIPKPAPNAATECNTGNGEEDDVLTPEEINFLSVVEFSVPVSAHAQLEPEEALVEVCEEATVKIFPFHLVLIRPDGVAAVELVIEELYELNEDEVHGVLDCILQRKGATHKQLIRIICSNAIARGALFKLLSARRNRVGSIGQSQQNQGQRFPC